MLAKRPIKSNVPPRDNNKTPDPANSIKFQVISNRKETSQNKQNKKKYNSSTKVLIWAIWPLCVAQNPLLPPFTLQNLFFAAYKENCISYGFKGPKGENWKVQADTFRLV